MGSEYGMREYTRLHRDLDPFGLVAAAQNLNTPVT